MGLAAAYRRMPAYVALPAALVLAALFALILAVVGAIAADTLLDAIHGRADLADAFLAFFYVGPSIAVLSFVALFSALANWYLRTSWRAPTFAFLIGASLLWVWLRDFGGIRIAPFLPGAIAWLTSCFLLHRRPAPLFAHAL